jgi:ornithine carbamoyltransferase
MAAHSSVPVINALTDQFHPCQVLADLATLAQVGDASHLDGTGHLLKSSEHNALSTSDKVKSISGKTLAYLGDGANNMAHSYLLGSATAGVNVRIGAPEQFMPDPEVVEDAKRIGQLTGAQIVVTSDAREAASDADVITTDAWLSMGMDKSEEQVRSAAFHPYQVDDELMKLAKPNALFLHCLPAYRGQEVTSSVIDGRQSAVFEEAEFRLHAQKALLTYLVSQNCNC